MEACQPPPWWLSCLVPRRGCIRSRPHQYPLRNLPHPSRRLHHPSHLLCNPPLHSVLQFHIWFFCVSINLSFCLNGPLSRFLISWLFSLCLNIQLSRSYPSRVQAKQFSYPQHLFLSSQLQSFGTDCHTNLSFTSAFFLFFKTVEEFHFTEKYYK